MALDDQTAQLAVTAAVIDLGKHAHPLLPHRLIAAAQLGYTGAFPDPHFLLQADHIDPPAHLRCIVAHPAPFDPRRL